MCAREFATSRGTRTHTHTRRALQLFRTQTEQHENLLSCCPPLPPLPPRRVQKLCARACRCICLCLRARVFVCACVCVGVCVCVYERWGCYKRLNFQHALPSSSPSSPSLFSYLPSSLRAACARAADAVAVVVTAYFPSSSCRPLPPHHFPRITPFRLAPCHACWHWHCVRPCSLFVLCATPRPNAKSCHATPSRPLFWLPIFRQLLLLPSPAARELISRYAYAMCVH